LLNIIWPIFIIIAFIYAIFTGKVEEINNSIFESASNAVNLTITFFGTICLWNGIMQIAKNTTLINKLTKLLTPIMKYLFPEIEKNDEVHKEISMNMVANILGLGNAATPLGLKAMKTLQKSNLKKDTLSNSMAIFIIINTASIQLIPTTVIAIRSSLKSINPTSIIIPVWIATIVAAISAIITAKILMKKY
jgi:spore maturation protein A